MKLVRTEVDTWAWTRNGDDGSVLAGTSHPNVEEAVETGLELLRARVRDGEMDPAEARELAGEARDALEAAAEETSVDEALTLVDDFLADVDGDDRPDDAGDGTS